MHHSWCVHACVCVYLDRVEDGLQGGQNLGEESLPHDGEGGELLVTWWEGAPFSSVKLQDDTDLKVLQHRSGRVGGTRACMAD